MNCSGRELQGSGFREPKRVVLLLLVLAAAWSWWRLDLGLPANMQMPLVWKFFSYAFRPALQHQASFVPAGTPALVLELLHALWMTVVFASAGISLALLLGLPMGIASARGFWFSRLPQGGLSCLFYTALYLLVRALSTLLRSVHELLWAVLFLAAFGLSEATAVLAIALPYAGVFARVFADLLDEANRKPADALEQAGAGRFATFVLALLPVSTPNLVAYTLYRFECALRSSAILGFFGIPTLGYYISTSFENLHYGEVWTYLYGMFALIYLVDVFSDSVRREIRL